MKIEITLEMPDSKPKKAPSISLEERLDHAVECMECQVHPKQAMAFIEKLTKLIATRTEHRDPSPFEIKLLQKLIPVIERFALVGRMQVPSHFYNFYDKIIEKDEVAYAKD